VAKRALLGLVWWIRVRRLVVCIRFSVVFRVLGTNRGSCLVLAYLFFFQYINSFFGHLAAPCRLCAVASVVKLRFGTIHYLLRIVLLFYCNFVRDTCCIFRKYWLPSSSWFQGHSRSLVTMWFNENFLLTFNSNCGSALHRLVDASTS